MFFLRKNTSIDNQFILLIINAFFMLFFANVLTAQCRYIPKTNQMQTRSQILVGGYTVYQTLAAKMRKSNDEIFLDVHFETKETEFSIKKDATLTLVFTDGQKVVLYAKDLLHSDAYQTCCDSVWLVEVAYLIPKKDYTLIAKNNIVEIHLELDNRLEILNLKSKKQGKLSDLINCLSE